MKKLSSTLKKLAENRARIAGQLKISEETVALIENDIATLNEKLAKVQSLLAMAENRRARILEELTVVDCAVINYDKNIKPERIGAINAWQGKYGKRGALRQFLQDTLKGRAPDFVPTSELSWLAIMEFSLTFAHKDLMTAWHANCLRGALKVLAAQGCIERSHEIVRPSSEYGSWRWKQASQPTLAQLAQ